MDHLREHATILARHGLFLVYLEPVEQENPPKLLIRVSPYLRLLLPVSIEISEERSIPLPFGKSTVPAIAHVAFKYIQDLRDMIELNQAIIDGEVEANDDIRNETPSALRQRLVTGSETMARHCHDLQIGLNSLHEAYPQLRREEYLDLQVGLGIPPFPDLFLRIKKRHVIAVPRFSTDMHLGKLHKTYGEFRLFEAIWHLTETTEVNGPYYAIQCHTPQGRIIDVCLVGKAESDEAGVQQRIYVCQKLWHESLSFASRQIDRLQHSPVQTDIQNTIIDEMKVILHIYEDDFSQIQQLWERQWGGSQ